MSDDAVAGAAVEEPLLLILLGERAVAARQEAEWRRTARTVLHALAHQEEEAARAKLQAFAETPDVGTATAGWRV